MKRMVTGLLATMTTAGLVAAADVPAAGGGLAKEPVQRVKITMVQTTGVDGKTSFELLDSAALTKLQQEIKLEERLHDKALAATDKAWRADDFTKGKIFPRGAIQKRTVRQLSTYTTKESADAALTRKEDDICREEERQAELEKKREESRRNIPNVRKKNDKPSADEAERSLLESRARDMYSTKMKELKDAAAKPAGADAPADGAKH